jgi:hypothetical protein
LEINKGDEIMKVLESSLDWSIEHLNKFEDIDLLPKPFEFNILGFNKETYYQNRE